MIRSGFHHLAVVDADGYAVGFVSALDLIRARHGLPASHPAAAPLYATTADDLWSDAIEFSEAGLADVPAQPGRFVLVADDDLVWTEPCHDLRGRLTELVERPVDRIAFFLEGGPLRLHIAVLEDGPHRVLGAQG